jgi:RND family efflux transporter MFP subunit
VCAGLAGLLLTAMGCGEKTEEEKPPVRPVYTVTVSDFEHERHRTFTGTARPAVESEVSFRVSGKLLELPVKLGSEVHTGDVLGRLDTSDYEIQVKQVEAQVTQAEALLKQARSQYARSRELYESDSTSKSELEASRASFESSEAQLESAQKSLELAKRQLEYCVVHAPFDGWVSVRSADVHETVTAGQPILKLASSDSMELSVGIPESLINRVQVGDAAEVRFDSLPGKIFSAEVREVGVENTGKSTYPLKLLIKENTDAIRPGMVGEATFTFETEGDAVLYVPPVSVVARPDATHYVWVVEGEPPVARMRDVEIGNLTTRGLQIRSGLKPGDVVVTRGVHKLIEGVEVQPLNAGKD